MAVVSIPASGLCPCGWSLLVFSALTALSMSSGLTASSKTAGTATDPFFFPSIEKTSASVICVAPLIRI